MKKHLLLVCLFLLSLAGSAQNIIRGEYFFDTDPGIGNGSPIVVATPADSVELNFSIPVNSLSLGMHNLYVRMLNDSGVWSLSENRLVNIYKVSTNSAIVAAEYFFFFYNGVGSGTAVSISTSADSVEFTSLISVSSLSSGLHNLYFRTKNADGVWSLTENRLVNIYKASANSNIVSAEYFFDTDPGVGLGNALTIAAAADSVEFTSAIASGSISLGLHNLYIRTKNSDGVWSLSENRLINVFKNVNSQIVWSEYFFTSDPGVGNGIGSAVPVPGDSVEFTTVAPTAGLGFGLGTHSIFMRTRNADGVWSLTEERTFSVCDTIGVVPSINGDTLITACVHQNGITYSIDTVLNADYYVWNLPAGASIISGDSTTTITVNYSPYALSGFVTVSGAYGNCVGTPTSMHVTFIPIPVTEICRATIDSASQKTLIEWQKPSESYVNGYVIFRQVAGSFTKIDTVSNSQYSSYLDIDTGSHPEINPQKYKIAVLDSCGNIGDTSAVFEHQTIRLNGSIQPGGIAKLYWNDYVGINDPSRYFKLLRDSTGSGPFNDTLVSHISPATYMNASDPQSTNYPLCRYVVEMVYYSNCAPGAKMMLSKNTSQSNIKNKTALIDSTLGSGFSAVIGNNSQFIIYPNPAKDFVNITAKISSSKYEVSLFDALGKEVIQSASSNYKNQSMVQLPLKGLARGLYFIKITTKEKQYISKLNIEP